jgi:hypothetical protein
MFGLGIALKPIGDIGVVSFSFMRFVPFFDPFHRATVRQSFDKIRKDQWFQFIFTPSIGDSTEFPGLIEGAPAYHGRKIQGPASMPNAEPRNVLASMIRNCWASPIGPFPGMIGAVEHRCGAQALGATDGSTATVRSISNEFCGNEVRCPNVSPDIWIMSDQEAKDRLLHIATAAPRRKQSLNSIEARRADKS